MKKAILISVATLLVLAIPAITLADDGELGAQTTSSAAIDTLGFLGKGIASLPSDPATFKIVKVGVAKMKVTVNETETNVAVGVLFLDEQKYIIRNVVIDNGSAAGDLYMNDSKVGSISVQSVIKGDTEVWAGTLTVDGTLYNVHILQAQRAMKRNEWKERVREYCSENATDGNCSAGVETFCENNPTNTRCMALFKAFCVRKNNMDDSRCRDFMKGWCKDNPEATDCRLLAIERSNAYCEENPKTPTCVALQKKMESFCETDSENGKCQGFCQKNPDKCRSIVKNMAEFCLENANNTNCLQYCSDNPKACVKLAANIAIRCMQEPNIEECREYCQEHPVQCRIVTAELARFCIGNQNDTKCAEFCENYPNACKKVTATIESYCSANTGTVACQAYCKRYPATCAAPKPVVAEVEHEQNKGTTNNTEQNQNQGGQ